MHSSEIKQEIIKILIIDDNSEHIDFISGQIESHGFDIITAEHGREGCTQMREHGNDIRLIILDREMPIMDGMEFITWLKKNGFERTPVIMITQDHQPETIQQGIEAGVFYYLTKPFKTEILHSVVNAAIVESNRRHVLGSEMQSHGRSIKLIHKCVFFVKTLEDAENTACFAANFFPQPDKVLQGVAELIINAVEHGNLGIGYDEKTTLLETKLWREEITKRQQLPEHINKQVTVYFETNDDEYSLTVKDEGAGFDWRKYSEINPARALHNHGRGIAQATLVSFDKLIYNDKGNEVRAVVYKKNSNTEIDWE